MWIWLLAILLFIVLVCWFLFSLSLQAEISFEKSGSDVKGFVRISYFFGWISIKRSLTDLKPKMTDEGPALDTGVTPPISGKGKQRRMLTAEEIWNGIKDWRYWSHLFHEVMPIVRWLLRRTAITEFTSDLSLGTGDAPTTGMAVGTTYSVINVVIGQLSRYCSLEVAPHIEVTPNFNAAVFDLRQRCIFKIRLGYAIWAGVRSLRIWKSTRGTKHGPSHSGVNANSNE